MNFEGLSKERELEEIRRKVDEIRDQLGMAVDEGIKETVVMLIALGFPTSGSCEGHIERALPMPWVDITVPNRPEEQFVGEKEIKEKVFKEIAEKYKITIKEIESGENINAYREAMIEVQKLLGEAEMTEEYKKWLEEYGKLLNKLNELLKEFYQGREVDEVVKLRIEKIGHDTFRIHNGGEYYKYYCELEKTEFNEEEKKKRKEILDRCREEMQAFTEFLKKKYFSEEI